MYQQLVSNIQRQVARTVFKVKIVQQDGQSVAAQPAPTPAAQLTESNGSTPAAAQAKTAVPVLAKSSGPSDEQIRTLGGSGKGASKGKGSNAAKRRKMIR
jgi:hypothetical protein